MNIFREIVSGKKNRFKKEGFNLDLTYVCPRIIAMAFPASGIESAYRNSISDVSDLLNKKHPKHYKVFNLSGRTYDYSKFNNKVHDFPWPDHHSPPIHTLFLLCEKIDNFLKLNHNNVIVVHCLAGKGRTGTVICCYLMYSGRVKTYIEALDYYAKKRFEVQGLGVTQPSQIRYIEYFGKILQDYKVSPTVKILEQVWLKGVPSFESKNSCKPYLEIYSAKDMEKKFTTKNRELIVFKAKEKDMDNSEFCIKTEEIVQVYGDILLKVKNKGFYRNKLMFRVAFNTAFLPENNKLNLTLKDLDPDSILKSNKFPKNFEIQIDFKSICSCTNYTPFELKCGPCCKDLEDEASNWSSIYSLLKSYKMPNSVESNILLFGDPDFDDIEETLITSKISPKENDPIKENSSSDEEDELETIFQRCSTKKISTPTNLSPKKEESKSAEKKPKLTKNKSFVEKSDFFALKSLKSKEN